MRVPAFLTRLWYFIRRDAYAADLEEEMRLHMEMRAESLRAQGMSSDDARHASRRRFGNVTGMTEASRDMWGFGSLDQLLQDVRFGARRLIQRPGLSVPIIAVLALCIGATTAVFSAVDAAMLRRLPFPRPQELYSLPNVDIPLEMDRDQTGKLLELPDVLAMTDIFANAAGYAAAGLNLMDEENPLRVNAGVVTRTFFSTLGVNPARGRGFSVEEGRPNGPPAVVLSHRLWQGHFGGEEVIGRALRLHGKPYTVVGIMPPGFEFPNESQLWIPLSVPTTFASFEPFRGFLPSSIVARVRPGVTRETAMSALLTGWRRAVAPATGESRKHLDDWVQEAIDDGLAVPFQQQLLGNHRRALLVLLGATGLLLLIGCANVANLLLSDAAVRRREIAVRGVLGASRPRIVRQLLIESAALSVAGAVTGLLLAPAVLKVLRAMMPAALAGVAPAQLDLRVLWFSVALSVVTSMAFGLWPALGATRDNMNDAIKSGAGHGATAAGFGKVRRVLVAAEIALTIVLLIGAGLMLRSFSRLMAEDTGMSIEQVATLETSFPRSVPPSDRLRIIRTALDRLSQEPGIVAAGIVNDLPLRGGGGISVGMTVHDSPTPPENLQMARQLTATEGYFPALGIRLLRGRLFTPADDSAGAPVAVISRATAENWWPNMEPLGRTFAFGRDGPPITVVGVVTDVRERRLETDPTPQMYRSAYREPPAHIGLVARGTLPPSVLMARLADAMRIAIPSQPVYNVRMMEDVIGASVAPRRTNTILIGLFGALALILAALGVYAVVSYGVARRSREFGIRAALGARGSDLVTLASRETAITVGIGIVAGIGAAWMFSRVLASLLYEVDAHDPFTFVVVPLVLIVPALAAALIPAMRAARVSPTEVMRAE
jgi:putative ABC transport system permease protein